MHGASLGDVSDLCAARLPLSGHNTGTLLQVQQFDVAVPELFVGEAVQDTVEAGVGVGQDDGGYVDGHWPRVPSISWN